jgi:hypothetical protein
VVTRTALSVTEALERDGFAVARGVLNASEIVLARQAIDEGRQRPGPFYRLLSGPSEARTDSDLFCLGRLPGLRAIAFDSELSRLAMQALERDSVVLLEDQWFASDPGGGTPSPWHQDEPYHPLDTPFLTTWLPLDPLPQGLSLRVVPGSHLGRIYAPIEFSSSEATLAGGSAALATVPDVDRSSLPTVEPRLEPGDVLLLDSRTLHAVAGGPPRLSRRLSFRWARPETRLRHREWPIASFWDELDHGLVEGDLLGGPAFPIIRTR